MFCIVPYQVIQTLVAQSADVNAFVADVDLIFTLLGFAVEPDLVSPVMELIRAGASVDIPLRGIDCEGQELHCDCILQGLSHT